MQTFTSSHKLFSAFSFNTVEKMERKKKLVGRNNSLSQMLTFNYKTVAALDLAFYLSWHL